MEKLVAASIKSFRSLGTEGMTWVFIKSLIISVIFLVLFIFGLNYAFLAALATSGWAITIYLKWLAGFSIIFIAWFLFPAILPLIISFFDETIIENIETHEYPESPEPIKISFLSELPHDLKFALKAILLNILLIPLYIFLFFIPPLSFLVFLALNGYLLGGEFYLTVARRHLPYKQALAARKANSQVVFFGGILLVFFSTIPIINLIAPFWGVALMTHLYHYKPLKSLN